MVLSFVVSKIIFRRLRDSQPLKDSCHRRNWSPNVRFLPHVWCGQWGNVTFRLAMLWTVSHAFVLASNVMLWLWSKYADFKYVIICICSVYIVLYENTFMLILFIFVFVLTACLTKIKKQMPVYEELHVRVIKWEGAIWDLRVRFKHSCCRSLLLARIKTSSCSRIGNLIAWTSNCAQCSDAIGCVLAYSLQADSLRTVWIPKRTGCWREPMIYCPSLPRSLNSYS